MPEAPRWLRGGGGRIGGGARVCVSLCAGLGAATCTRCHMVLCGSHKAGTAHEDGLRLEYPVARLPLWV